MKFERYYTTEGWEAKMKFENFKVKDGAHTLTIEAPKGWSQNAVEILANKYMRKAGVPRETVKVFEEGVPIWLQRSKPHSGRTAFDRELSIQEVIRRIVGHWTYAGWQLGYFGKDEESARIFRDELCYLLHHQVFAPNSPQWFNTGLWWAYGLEGDTINWKWDHDTEKAFPLSREQAYQFPQTSACFISSVADSLIGEGGILDLLRAEASIFKYGSGSGANFSALRAKGAPLAGGGKSSGLMSFLKVFDANAGAIKSGGTTRRAAKMVVVNADHPEAMDFVTWKAREELKVRCLDIGAGTLSQCVHEEGLDKDDVDLLESLNTGWESEAYQTVSGQNSNNSLRVSDKFMEHVSAPGATVGGDGEKAVNSDCDLFWALCKSTWKSGDPGMQFDDACNKWHTVPKVGRQNATNPCSEYSFIDDSACNLASINLIRFLSDEKTGEEGNDYFDADGFAHVCRLVTTVLDITVSMSSYPTAKIAENSYKYRPLGLGYANLGGLLMAQGIAYGSEFGRKYAAAVTDLMHAAAWRTSQELSEELGAFEGYKEQHLHDVGRVMSLHMQAHKQHAHYTTPYGDIFQLAGELWDKICDHNGLRNAQLTLIAPTGTIGLLMDCATTGIEPDYALVKHKKLAGGGFMNFVNPMVARGLRALGYSEQLIEQVAEDWATEQNYGSLEGLIDKENLSVFACANEISWQDHLLMMAAVQPFLSGAISKTVNLPNSATVEDISQCYIMAWKLGLKAVAPYRDGSKGAQPLTAKKKVAEPVVEVAGEKIHPDFVKVVGEKPDCLIMDDFAGQLPDAVYADQSKVAELADLIQKKNAEIEAAVGSFDEKWPLRAEVLPRRVSLPAERNGRTFKVKIGGHSVFLRTGEYEDGRLGEIFLTMAREGSSLALFMNALAMAVSIGLQYGVPLKEFVDAFQGTNGEPGGFVQGSKDVRFCSSVIDYIARQLDARYGVAELFQVRGHDQPAKGGEPGKASQCGNVEKPATVGHDGPFSGNACPSCGKFTLVRNGTCHVCTNCGETTGCS